MYSVLPEFHILIYKSTRGEVHVLQPFGYYQQLPYDFYVEISSYLSYLLARAT